MVHSVNSMPEAVHVGWRDNMSVEQFPTVKVKERELRAHKDAADPLVEKWKTLKEECDAWEEAFIEKAKAYVEAGGDDEELLSIYEALLLKRSPFRVFIL